MTAATAQVAPEREVGTVLTMRGAALAELVAEPWDLVWIDLEHGALGPGDAQELILGAQAVATTAFVRLPRYGGEALISPMLDAGADGLVIPDVRDRGQAETVARRVRLAPGGDRGFGPRRSALRGRIFQAQRVRTPRLWLQIESRQGASNAFAIASVDGVDALIVGLADLSIDVRANDKSADSLPAAVQAVHDGALNAGVRFGVAGPLLDPPASLTALLHNADALIHSTDARMCAAAVDRAAESLRESVPLTQGARR